MPRPSEGTNPDFFYNTWYVADGAPEQVFQQTADTFREDQEVLELQQLRISAEPERLMLDIASDVGARQARQVLLRLMKAERDPNSCSPSAPLAQI